ncbi:hypothetical protein [Nocardioides daejeonensis]|uniref:hypothetical protein n=1 Tax=Nocardioides daejeonensis TaxID=1046556 RepID=UPI000D745A43|nr:hypothetical protein [Nocardioides daejeonensis]
MRMKRLLTGVISAALLGMTPIALAATPAQAATPTTTWIEGKITYSKAEYGRRIWLDGNVKSANGYPSGTVLVQRRWADESSWSTVLTDTTPGYFSYDFKATRNAVFRVVFQGGSDSQYIYPAAQSNDVTFGAYRKLDVKTSYSSLVVKGKVSPDFKNKKFKVQVKKGGWKNFKKVKTNKKGKYAVKLAGSRKGTKYRFVVPSNKKFLSTTSGIITARIY